MEITNKPSGTNLIINFAGIKDSDFTEGCPGEDDAFRAWNAHTPWFHPTKTTIESMMVLLL